MRGPLQPYNPAEAIGTAEAADIAGRHERTVRNWCADHQIGRRLGGHWFVSIVALDIWLAGDREALAAYLDGDRGDLVRRYFARRGILLPESYPAQPASAFN